MNEDTGSKKPKENIFYIKGMHCSACEILIEKQLLKKSEIVAADVSLGDNSAKIYVERGKFIRLEELNKEFAEDNYIFSKEPFLETELPLLSLRPGRLIINDKKLFKLLKTFIVVILFLIVFYFIEKLQLGRFVSVDNSSSWVTFFFLGLIAGVSSCAALIGGVLLSLIKHWNELYLTEESKRKTPHILFHAGRLISFFVLGGLLGALGELVSLDNTTVYASLVIGVSLIMFILSLQMLGVGWVKRFRFSLPKFITRKVADEKAISGKFMPFFIGVMTFFLPCGFTLIAQGVALASGSFIAGAMILLFFALGTMPMLLGISAAGLTFTKRPHLAAKFSAVAGLMILFFSIYNINGQLNVLGLLSLSDLKWGTGNTEIGEVISGEQEVHILAEEFEYRAKGATVFQAGLPTKLIVDNQGVLGCGNFIAARGLIDNFVSLNRGKNIIDLGKPKKGNYKLTCSMGMVPPVTITFK